MSFTKIVKEELVSIPIENVNEKLAEFLAFVSFNGNIVISKEKRLIEFKTNNPTVGKRFLLATKSLYNTETKLIKKEQFKLKKKPQIIIQILTKIKEILSEIKLLDDIDHSSDLILSTIESKVSFLRAAFLCSGSVNNPIKSNYHLEISSERIDLLNLLKKICLNFDLEFKISKRRKKFIAYLKDAEKISDFLMRIGAQNSVFKFEDIRIKRDFNNSINRIINCEIANEKKSLKTSVEQIKDIKTLLSIKQEYNEKLKKVIDLRLKNKDANLRELTIIYEKIYNEPISKSGLNHRFQKIKQIAKYIRGTN